MLPAWQLRGLAGSWLGQAEAIARGGNNAPYVIEIPALMDNATWEAEAIEHEPEKLQ